VNGAAGLAGNLVAESGVIPTRIEGSASDTPMRSKNFQDQVVDHTAEDVMRRSASAQVGPKLPGIGLAQWTSAARRAGLFQHSYEGQVLGADVLFSMEAQIDYLVQEMQSTYPRVNQVLTDPGVTVDQASDEVVYNFEVPGALLEEGAKRPRTDPRVLQTFQARRAHSQRALTIYNGSPP